MTRRIVVSVLACALLIAFAWLWHSYGGGVTHVELKTAVERESAEIQSRIDDRYEALDRKLDRIESKLDKLIDMATPKLPDGMRPADH